jgi:peptidoglycan hydrolase CwlO-like protein
MPNNNGPKGIGLIVVMITVLVGIYSITSYLGREIEFISTQIHKADEQIKEHSNKEGHPGIIAEVAAIRTQFQEIETQFSNLDDRMQKYEFWLVKWLETKDTIAALQERVVYLEKELERLRNQR